MSQFAKRNVCEANIGNLLQVVKMTNTAQKFDATFSLKTPAKAASTFIKPNPKATLDKTLLAADCQRLEYESEQKDLKLEEKDDEIGCLAAEKAEMEDEIIVLKRALARANVLLDSKVKENCRLRQENEELRKEKKELCQENRSLNRQITNDLNRHHKDLGAAMRK